uniref:ORF17 n=1 Tax=Nitrosopumilaceae spindle-shaped virus TaxID=3065433 RepID=A0AAT9J752_9VIRU
MTTSPSKRNQKVVEPINLTDEDRKKEPPLVAELMDISDKLIEKKLCGFSITLRNGWRISFKNNRFAKQIGVPMP